MERIRKYLKYLWMKRNKLIKDHFTRSKKISLEEFADTYAAFIALWLVLQAPALPLAVCTNPDLLFSKTQLEDFMLP